jgi:hypothetical protein
VQLRGQAMQLLMPPVQLLRAGLQFPSRSKQLIYWGKPNCGMWIFLGQSFQVAPCSGCGRANTTTYAGNSLQAA